MARFPNPWRRGGPKGAWYAQVRGKQVRLAGPDATRDEARQVLAAVVSGHAPESGPAAVTVRDCANLYLEVRVARAEVGAIAKTTLRNTVSRLGVLCDRWGDQPAASLTAEGVRRWLESKPWSPGYMRRLIVDLQCALRHAVTRGVLESDPLKTLRRPAAGRREFDAPADMRTRALEACEGAFRILVEMLIETGCRPIELARATAADLDAAGGTLTVSNKTRHATGRQERIVYLSDRALAILTEQAAAHPDGPLLRHDRGGSWKPSNWGEHWRQVREKIGLPESFVLYSLRHAWATDAILAGVSPFVVAELIGHTNPTMLARHYSQVGQRRDALRDAARQVRPGKEN